MACEKIPNPHGGMIIACNRGQRLKPCVSPGCTKGGDRLCDFKLRGSKAGQTCDAPVCTGHAHRVSSGVDYCPAHAKEDRRLVP